MQYIQKYFITQFHPSVVTLDQRLLAAHTTCHEDGVEGSDWARRFTDQCEQSDNRGRHQHVNKASIDTTRG